MDAFDADVLIYAARKDVRGRDVSRLIGDAATSCVGSVILLSEVFARATARMNPTEYRRLVAILGALDLKQVDHETAQLAGVMRGKYRLRTPGAIHLATAVLWGAERFHTDNSRDFGQQIDEIEIVLRV